MGYKNKLDEYLYKSLLILVLIFALYILTHPNFQITIHI